ncbi:hypothetical protein F4813DRAFT_349672 [Daldinia decipiens]|uniref:uncharacterized protein n=1 Tax=Daldinia decipiens TaxID=326647 RepID=UPI0020C59169|nr:uncharacterized protein F4813DRAFT_349672 [Daldinia decipiens]KAI1660365.1 hypothetical protein F4813DRAFT_349672 [Daldinia decipiens]
MADFTSLDFTSFDYDAYDYLLDSPIHDINIPYDTDEKIRCCDCDIYDDFEHNGDPNIALCKHCGHAHCTDCEEGGLGEGRISPGLIDLGDSDSSKDNDSFFSVSSLP